MPRAVSQKVDGIFRMAKPKTVAYRIGDGGGLYLLVNPNGTKAWRWQYTRPTGGRNTLHLGDYPATGLAEARDKRNAARKLLEQGIDPSEHRKQVKAMRLERAENSLEAICREWLASRVGAIEPAQISKATARLEKDVFPWLGGKPIAEITAPDVLTVMRRIDARGARYTAHKVKSEIGQAIRYAIATGRAERDPTGDLRGAIPPARGTHHAAITDPKQVSELLRAIDGFKGTLVVRSALLLAPLVFVRPGELRKARWADIDFDKAEWRYVVSKTKTDHLVPLSRQALAILGDLYPLTGNREFLFPGRDPKKPMSDAAINAALRRMGYDTKTEITGHGFRAMARTILHEELHHRPEVIEHQLAHAVPDSLGTAYNRTRFLKERTIMMQEWADYLDKLKAGAVVVALHVAA